jgi:hypothetical protein
MTVLGPECKSSTLPLTDRWLKNPLAIQLYNIKEWSKTSKDMLLLSGLGSTTLSWIEKKHREPRMDVLIEKEECFSRMEKKPWERTRSNPLKTKQEDPKTKNKQRTRPPKHKVFRENSNTSQISKPKSTNKER